MGLYKSIVNEIGVITNYHIIKSVERECDHFRVTVSSYTDSGFRQKEKALNTTGLDRDELFLELNNLYLKYAPPFGEDIGGFDYDEALSDEDKIIAEDLKDKIRRFDFPNADYSVNSITVIVRLATDDISFENIYEALKNVEPFVDAEDC